MNIQIRRGETLELTVTADDSTAETVNLLARASDDTIVINETATFTDSVATIRTSDTDLDVGDYDYMLTVTYADGYIEMLPDAADCDDEDCTLPVLTICEAITVGVS